MHHEYNLTPEEAIDLRNPAVGGRIVDLPSTPGGRLLGVVAAIAAFAAFVTVISAVVAYGFDRAETRPAACAGYVGAECAAAVVEGM